MRCSVVFGVTLRFLVINISSSPAINTAAYYQGCVITCDTLAVLHRRPRWQNLPVAALTQAVKPDIGSESRFLPIPPAFDAYSDGNPPNGGSHRNIATPFGMQKLEWCGYPMVKKFRRHVYSFWYDPQTWQTHTHRQTDTAWRHKPRLFIASRGKK